MTSLEQFLNKKVEKNNDVVISEPASGSFTCQDNDCKEVVFEGYVDRMHNKLHWTCSNGHDSSVVI
jgi:hypothetical protein